MRALLLPLLAVATLLAGCQTPQVGRDADSPYFVPPIGTRLVLEKPIAVRGGQAALFIQTGKVLPYPELDRYDPHCKFELRTVAEERRKVEPDTFLVRKVERYSRSVQRGPTEPVRVAARGSIRIGADDDGGPFAEVMTTRLYLHSERQPEVFRMECSHWDDFHFPEHLTLNQMRQTLKGVFRVELPGGE